jgi:5'-nucleotidase
MVAVLNAMGMDYATFGNHEFDLKEGPFFERVKEAKFTWISCNVFDANGKPFEGVKSH